jgi:hypothetical protein
MRKVSTPHSRFKSLSLAKSSNVPLLGRTRLMAHLQQVAVPFAPSTNYPKLSAFFSSKLWPWIWNYLKSMFRGRYKPYPTYASNGSDGVYTLRSGNNSDSIKIAIAGDWGTGTFEAFEVAGQISNVSPDYTIHLGDVYYVGDDREVQENFLGADADEFTPVSFPKGIVGTFAMLGNHEMYGGGGPYFTEMIGASGYCDTGAGEKQKASFFCLETPYWRIIALDTGYNSVGVPILGSIPFVKKIPWFGANCELQPELLSWLSTNVKPQQNRKATLLLSHHQYYSVYEQAYGRPAEQLKDLFSGQKVVWLWGHEHRLSIYDEYSPDQNVLCHGRCLGNGGMPVELEATGKTSPLLFQDPRGLPNEVRGSNQYPVGDGTYAGWNGYLTLTLDESTMTINYFDLRSLLLFSESFNASGNGDFTHTVLSNPVLQAPAT